MVLKNTMHRLSALAALVVPFHASLLPVLASAQEVVSHHVCNATGEVQNEHAYDSERPRYARVFNHGKFGLPFIVRGAGAPFKPRPEA